MSSAFPTRRQALLATLAAPALLTACGGNGDDTSGPAQIRAINLSSDLDSVDLFANDVLQFGAVDTDELAASIGIESGTYTMKVKRAGEGAVLLNGTYSLVKDQFYTAIVWGRETSLRLSTLPETESADNIGTGNTRVRIFNATTDTGAVDIFFTTAGADLGETAATQSALGSGTLSSFKDLTAGAYRLRVTGVGNPEDVRLDVPAVTLLEKQHATLVLTAGASGVLVNGTLIQQQGERTTMKTTKARVRVAAGVANQGSVSLRVAGSTLVGGQPSPGLGTYRVIEAGELPMVVGVGGVDVASTQTFVAGTDYTVLAYGAAGAEQVRVLSDDNRLPSSSSRVKMRLVHGAAGTTPVSLSVDFGVIIGDLALGDAAYINTNAATSAQVDVTSTTAGALYSRSEVNLQGQSVYSVFVLGGSTDGKPTGVLRKER